MCRITHLGIFPLNSGCCLEWGGKCLSTNFKNSFPTLVLTYPLQGGLSQSTLHCLFLFVLLEGGRQSSQLGEGKRVPGGPKFEI